MARFVEVINTSSGGAERRVKMPFDTFVAELAEQSLGAELTADELAAIQGAADPDASNVFATMADIPTDTGGTFEAAANSPADGLDDEFTFTGTPVCVFRNGVNETRLGTIAGSAFTFDSAPADGDDIEAIL
jgi:hypothetical protein